MMSSIAGEQAQFTDCRSRLLMALPAEDRRLLAPALKRVALPLHQSIGEAHEATPFVYFVESGIVSLVARTPTHKAAETGLVGWDGAVGIGLVLGDTRGPFDAVVQLPGWALRIAATDFLAALDHSASLRLVLARYARALWIQTAYTAVANSSARLDARLARWLLMIHDRIEGDKFDVTHEFLATMLAVRRPGVTVALHELEYAGLIRSTRGTVQVTDRAGLIELADGVYMLPEVEYERLLGCKLMRDPSQP